ncbi:regenerating islet-derived protein 4 isoform X1 [Anolis carolinensis]|uniref:regenerating islet-derived protein 4 isoform X1 n=1 Tax=Anolis carolinensis TaxID=28377 RepID=UPI002F2B8F08
MGPGAYVSLGLLTCLASAPFIKGPINFVITAATGLKVSATLCPENWMYYKDNCYGYFPQKKDWKEAEKECQSRNAHLVSILSKKEACRVQKFLSRFQPDGDIWIGLHNPSKFLGRLLWEWTDGQHMDHSQWSPEEPNNFENRGEFCAEIWKSSEFKKWNDETCDVKNSFICKLSLEETEEQCFL